MDKLFDLMTMGAKYQLLCCTTLGEVLQASAPPLVSRARSACPPALQ
jgi:hypothetical protein